MDGFVTDYISTLTAELGRQPTYEEYSQVMTAVGLGHPSIGVRERWPIEAVSSSVRTEPGHFLTGAFWRKARSEAPLQLG